MSPPDRRTTETVPPTSRTAATWTRAEDRRPPPGRAPKPPPPATGSTGRTLSSDGTHARTTRPPTLGPPRCCIGPRPPMPAAEDRLAGRRRHGRGPAARRRRVAGGVAPAAGGIAGPGGGGMRRAGASSWRAAGRGAVGGAGRSGRQGLAPGLRAAGTDRASTHGGLRRRRGGRGGWLDRWLALAAGATAQPGRARAPAPQARARARPLRAPRRRARAGAGLAPRPRVRARRPPRRRGSRRLGGRLCGRLGVGGLLLGGRLLGRRHLLRFFRLDLAANAELVALRRTRSACASCTLEEWLFTPMPSCSQRSRSSLLASPNSLASSCTRGSWQRGSLTLSLCRCRSTEQRLQSRAAGPDGTKVVLIPPAPPHLLAPAGPWRSPAGVRQRPKHGSDAWQSHAPLPAVYGRQPAFRQGSGHPHQLVPADAGPGSRCRYGRRRRLLGLLDVHRGVLGPWCELDLGDVDGATRGDLVVEGIDRSHDPSSAGGAPEVRPLVADSAGPPSAAPTPARRTPGRRPTRPAGPTPRAVGSSSASWVRS